MSGSVRDLRPGEAAAPEVAITGVGLWLPGCPSAADWVAGVRGQLETVPRGATFKPMHRRRAGALGRSLSDATAEAAAQAELDLATAPTVIGSSIGEATTLVKLLEQMWRGDQPMSPADFTVSVHNAASGVMSISAGNKGFTTSIAADFDTPASALFEGVGLVATEGEAVLVACGDEGAPPTLLEGDEAWGLASAAVVLAPIDADVPPLARIQLLLPSDASDGVDLTPAKIETDSARNPQAGLVDLVDAVLGGRSGILRLDRGEGRGYRVAVACGGAS